MDLAKEDPHLAAVFEERRWALEALSSLGDGVLIVDERARIVYFNQAAVRLVSADRRSRNPQAWSDESRMFRSDERTPYPANELPLLRALAGEAVENVEIFARNDAPIGGFHLICTAFPLRSESGGICGATVLFRDATARRLRETKLLEAQRQKRAILDNIPDIAWLKDREGRVVAANLPFALAAGRASTEDVLGKSDFELWPHELATRYRADDDEIMASGVHKRVEEPMIDALGGVRWLETFKTPILGDHGEVIGTTGIGRDITDRKRAEQALQVANDELERRFAQRTAELAQVQGDLVRKERLVVLGQLAGGVAHQIRNPLAAIMNATYVLKRHLGPDQHPNVEDSIRIIHDEVRHANLIITGLLDYARVRSPDRYPAEMKKVLARVLAADRIPDTIRVEQEYDDVPILEIDDVQIHDAIFNVVRNGIEAMPDGGVLRVTMKREDEQIVVSVSDSGRGVRANVREHLFEPLHSTKPTGVGLGLVTARTFIEAHGGHIDHVEVPSGTRFEIRLPIPDPNAHSDPKA